MNGTKSDVKVPVTVRLLPEEVKFLDDLAPQRSATRSSLICDAVSHFIRNQAEEATRAEKTKVDMVTEQLRGLTRGEMLTILEKLGIISISLSLNSEKLHGSDE